ncbi:hypothetical protein ACE1AT_28495 [Pelatocladus sp. BLCC-F211]|jgi:hypothetical protein|uniref:XRE family transcriptional regulator n=1 Tax=Pelatocladus maniniholoensis HA4357-MV3 TaxID=1117104 RepID=A0A9E3LWH5_9NOST|nr:hypothetical protein [Pelatocladus maniniholoensis HA4357-MV3]RAM48043.1 MAG: hypothetical protein C6Y22_30175 [Hapalosiphonaceae cyanobacterium JJU2]BAZ69410.1 hypothetical protein NIES4106_41820 [Fischerella sp. NIES-4106]
MSQHREIFNQLLLAFDYSAKQVSAWTGIHESRLSRFRTGKLDLEAGEFFSLLACMPKEFQDSFWLKIREGETSWRIRVLSASHHEIEEILRGLADRWASSTDEAKIAS